MVTGFGLLDGFASVLCTRDAALAKSEKTLASAEIRSALASPEMASQMRRLFRPSGSVARQDVVVAADVGAASEGGDPQAWAAYCKAKRARKNAKDSEDRVKQGGSKASEDGRTVRGFNRRTGGRNRRLTCSSEYDYAPQSPQERNRYGGPPLHQKVAKKPPSKPYPSIAAESPLEVQPSRLSGSDGPERMQEQSFSTTLEVGGQITCAKLTVW